MQNHVCIIDRKSYLGQMDAAVDSLPRGYLLLGASSVQQYVDPRWRYGHNLNHS